MDGFCHFSFSLGPLSGGDGDGEETPSVHVHQGRFSLDDVCRQTTPFFMLYVMISGGFSGSYFKTIGNGVVESRFPGQTRAR